MKKGIFSSFKAGLLDTEHGEGYGSIVRYAFPEFISALVLYSLPLWLDAYFIGQLESTTMYATLGATNNLIHFIIKLAESISVSVLIMSGQFNGMQEYHKVGRTVADTFWATCFLGALIASFLFFGAQPIYVWYGVPHDMIPFGVPFLRLRAVSVFFTFLYMALIGFLRGIKNTKTPMTIFMIGSVVFLFFDYALILGRFGFPAMALQGSAVASLVQYGVMVALSLGYIVLNKNYRRYGIDLLKTIADRTYVKQLFLLSWPVMIDKATMAWSYIWLCKMINPMGTCAVASFCVVKDMERFAFLPAIAFAQVITFLVSNDYGLQNWVAIKSNLKKICLLSSIAVFSILVLFSINPAPVIRFFDKKGEFTPLAAYAFPIVSVLVFFDLIQLILSGALRGAGNVRVVMYVRLAICLGYFVPLSYVIATTDFQSETMKFIMLYGSFYVGNALMSIVYVGRLRGELWKVSSLQETG